MIASLRGTVTRWEEDASVAWIEVQGVTYEVRIPAFAAEWIASRLGEPETEIFTFYHVSERNPVPLLVGFQHLAERDFFRKFIEVPDMGPTKAVRALTRPVSEIARWIEAEDVKSLRELPGIGQRLSQTIVAQLHGRLVQEALLRDSAGELVPAATPADDLRTDALEALVALQYSRREAESAIEEALQARPDIEQLEELLRVILEQQARA